MRVETRSSDFKSLPTSISRCFSVWRHLVRDPEREARLRLEMLSLDCGITAAQSLPSEGGEGSRSSGSALAAVPSFASAERFESARKRAVLVTDVVSHLARYRIALKALADFERRHEDIERADDLEDIHLSLDDAKQQFGIDADDAHAGWVNLRRLSESEQCRLPEV